MKRGTDLKIKFAELRAALGLETWATKGVLQSVWDFAAENAMHGDIGKFTDEQIALGIGWPVDKAELLVGSLVAARWLDRCRNHRLVIHEWPEHCESWVRKRVERSGKPFVTPNARRANRKTPLLDPSQQSDETVRNEAKRTGDESVESREVAPERLTTGAERPTTADNGALPLPGPLPLPLPEPVPVPEPVPGPDPLPGVPAVAGPREKSPGSIAWDAYARAYEARYGVAPVRNSKTNAQMVELCKRVGNEDAPHVAAFFVGSNDAYYVKRGHSLDCLVKDAEKLRTEWATNRRVNGSQAHRNEVTEANPFLRLAAEERAKGVRH